jgi:hypothetical protein
VGGGCVEGEWDQPVVGWSLLFVSGGGRQGRGVGGGGFQSCPCRPAEDILAVVELGDGSRVPPVVFCQWSWDCPDLVFFLWFSVRGPGIALWSPRVAILCLGTVPSSLCRPAEDVIGVSETVLISCSSCGFLSVVLELSSGL